MTVYTVKWVHRTLFVEPIVIKKLRMDCTTETKYKCNNFLKKNFKSAKYEAKSEINWFGNWHRKMKAKKKDIISWPLGPGQLNWGQSGRNKIKQKLFKHCTVYVFAISNEP